MVFPALRTGVYPRGRGGTRCPAPRAMRRSGLSPRARGNLHRSGNPIISAGSIPAGAGEPRDTDLRGDNTWVYPRGRGGTSMSMAIPARALGLSPRARGNLDDLIPAELVSGSIPAGAGEPHPSARSSPSPWVYPAGAGEPRKATDAAPPPGVYPRGRGGTAPFGAVFAFALGLSPRARGNPADDSGAARSRGSIPAGAGEPGSSSRRAGSGRVYPRGRGGTFGYILRAAFSQGLSPRARGNRKANNIGNWVDGSIPAGAGEPSRCGADPAHEWVYPRGRGGTPL